MSNQWIVLAKSMLPVLAVLLLLLVICRGLMLWQDRTYRTWRNWWFTLMYLSFFVLCVVRSLNLPLPWVSISYLFLVLFFVPCDYCEWRNTIRYLLTKNTKFIAEEADAKRMTLDTLAQSDVPVALDATPIAVEPGGHVALEATPVKPKG